MFALLMVSCYTANLSAFLTIQRMDQSFSKPEDLVNHPEIRCGTVRRGATNNFIKVGIYLLLFKKTQRMSVQLNFPKIRSID